MQTDYRAALEAVAQAATLDEAVEVAAKALHRRRVITRSDYLQLIGLFALARDHLAALREIERVACAITGDEPGAGTHTTDAVWGEEDLAHLLDVLGIEVVEAVASAL